MENKSFNEFKEQIKFYMGQFDKEKYNMELYNSVIKSSKLTAEQLKGIICWKLRGKLRYDQLKIDHQKLIDRAIERVSQINEFKDNKISKSEFDETLQYISPSGPIIRLFILHICKPQQYALFDQHVFRAFYYFKTGEIYWGIVTSYIVKNHYKDYCQFFQNLCEEFKGKYEPKQIDAALMVYGKKLKKYLTSEPGYTRFLEEKTKV